MSSRKGVSSGVIKLVAGFGALGTGVFLVASLAATACEVATPTELRDDPC
jgi:hypothetical protein